jgi:hypothetical protein
MVIAASSLYGTFQEKTCSIEMIYATHRRQAGRQQISGSIERHKLRCHLVEGLARSVQVADGTRDPWHASCETDG